MRVGNKAWKPRLILIAHPASSMKMVFRNPGGEDKQDMTMLWRQTRKRKQNDWRRTWEVELSDSPWGERGRKRGESSDMFFSGLISKDILDAWKCACRMLCKVVEVALGRWKGGYSRSNSANSKSKGHPGFDFI